MAKVALPGARRGTLYRMDPEMLTVLIEDDQHPAFDERARLPLNEATVASLSRADAVPPPAIEVRRAVIANGHCHPEYRVHDDPAGSGTRYAVIVTDGRRRTLHLREANRRRAADGLAPLLMPMELRPGDVPESGDADPALSLLELAVGRNQHALAEPPCMLARKVAALYAAGRPSDELGQLCGGVTRQTIHNWIRLAGLDRSVQDAVDDGRVPMTVALTWHDMPAREQRRRLAAVVEGRPDSERRPIQRAVPRKRLLGVADRLGQVRHTAIRAGTLDRHDDQQIVTVHTVLRWAAGEISDAEAGAESDVLRRLLADDANAADGGGHTEGSDTE